MMLEIEDLNVTFRSALGVQPAVRNVSLKVGQERVGIVGESGSGKSTTGRAIIGLLPSTAHVSAARLAFDGIELNRLRPRAMERLRGRRIAMILQDPKHALNPSLRIGDQIAEAHELAIGQGRTLARRAALDMLEAVAIRDPERVAQLFPHQVSGGMGQRIMIAMMLIGRPELVIADEPTSALDVTVQRQVLNVLDEVVTRQGAALILISHNLPLVAHFCDRIAIMYGGRIVETCTAAKLTEAQHPYTLGLLDSIPRLSVRRERLPQLQRDPAWLV